MRPAPALSVTAVRPWVDLVQPLSPACELGTTEEPEIRARPAGGPGSCAPREVQPGGRSGDWPKEGFQEGRG